MSKPYLIMEFDTPLQAYRTALALRREARRTCQAAGERRHAASLRKVMIRKAMWFTDMARQLIGDSPDAVEILDAVIDGADAR